ncbi:MAG: class III signal peptide-containing protein [Candidatus Micrarchaeota archaeon]
MKAQGTLEYLLMLGTAVALVTIISYFLKTALTKTS